MIKNAEKASEIIGKFNIPPKPSLLSTLEKELVSGHYSPESLAEIISQDVALSGAVIKTVNSSLFGLRRNVADIRQAVVFLGVDWIKNLFSFFAMRQLSSSGSSISLEKFWDNTMEVANMSKIVLRHLEGVVSVDPEQLYSLALFRDCGLPLMAMKYANYKEVLSEANRSSHRCFTEIEDSHYDTNHATVGYFMASSWKLPSSLCQLVLRHHDESFLSDTTVSEGQKDLFSLIKISSAAAVRYKYQTLDGEWPLTSAAVLGRFQMSELDFEELILDSVDTYQSELAAL